MPGYVYISDTVRNALFFANICSGCGNPIIRKCHIQSTAVDIYEKLRIFNDEESWIKNKEQREKALNRARKSAIKLQTTTIQDILALRTFLVNNEHAVHKKYCYIGMRRFDDDLPFVSEAVVKYERCPYCSFIEPWMESDTPRDLKAAFPEKILPHPFLEREDAVQWAVLEVDRKIEELQKVSERELFSAKAELSDCNNELDTLQQEIDRSEAHSRFLEAQARLREARAGLKTRTFRFIRSHRTKAAVKAADENLRIAEDEWNKCRAELKQKMTREKAKREALLQLLRGSNGDHRAVELGDAVTFIPLDKNGEAPTFSHQIGDTD